MRSASRSSGLVATGILASRLTGLARERAVGHYFGTGFAADAFTAAFRIPNLFQHLLGEGVLSASMIPVYSRLLADGKEDEAGRVAGALAGLLLAVVVGLVLAVVALARPLTTILAPGLAEETFELTVTLVRILTPAVGFLVLSAWCLAVLNSHRRFFLSYVAPVLCNVAQIAVLAGAGLALSAGDLPGELTSGNQASLVIWLAWGTVLGGLLQFGAQIPTVRRLAPRLRPGLRTDLPGVRGTVRSFIPIVTGRAGVHLGGYVHLVLASFLAVGALSALRYGQMLYVLPISLFGMSVAAAELPELSSRDHDPVQLRRRVEAGLARIAFFVVPTTVAYLLIGDLVVAAIFQTGAFDERAVLQVSVVLGVYALGLLASTGSRLLQSVLYATGDPRTPMRVALLRVAVSLILGAVLMFQFDRVILTATGLAVVGDLPALSPLPAAFREPSVASAQHLGAVGLALAATVAAWAEYGLLRRRVSRQIGRVRLGGARMRPLLIAAGAAVVVALVARPLVAPLPPLPAGVLATVATGGGYVIAARLLKVPETTELRRLVSQATGRRSS